jgi:hypothetical protein
MSAKVGERTWEGAGEGGGQGVRLKHREKLLAGSPPSGKSNDRKLQNPGLKLYQKKP